LVGVGLAAPARPRPDAVLAILALVVLLGARILGPSDAWDQTQPTTIAYTTDILVNGHWVLPSERSGRLATKPPLYNWLAVPAVAMAGHSSEFAHKLPSVVALVLCFGLVVRLGRRLVSDPLRDDPAVGWLAGLIFLSGYTVFKLGYLARPDMLLVLWMVLGWAAATRLCADQVGPDPATSRRRWLALGFWLCTGLAALTKGPAVLPLLIYAAIAPRLLVGRWSAGRVLEWSWGPLVALLVFGSWVWGVWRIAPEHLVQELWAHEIVGRITGFGDSPREPIALLTTAPNMVLYYLSRFEPWCVFSILGMYCLWRRSAATGQRWWRQLGRQGAALHGTAIFIVVMLTAYTLVAGKRADYLAPAYPPSALLAAWWLLRGPWRTGIRFPWMAPVCAGVVLTGLTIHNSLELSAPYRGFGDAVADFARETTRHVRARPAPVVLLNADYTHLGSLLGSAGPSGPPALRLAATAGGPFWLVTPRVDEARFERWRRERGIDIELAEVCHSRPVPPTRFWPGEMVLYRAVKGTVKGTDSFTGSR